MGESLAELRGEYEQFLRGTRYNLTDRIVTACDDYSHLKGLGSLPSTAALRVGFTLAELRSAGLSERLRMDPLRHLRALEAACHAIADEERPGYDIKSGGRRLAVSLTGPVGAAPASPRHLTAAQLRQLVCVEGVATKVSTIKPKVVESVHYCPKTKKHLSRHYVDATDPHLGLRAVDATGQEMPDRYVNITTTVYPTKDEDGNLLETEFGLSTFKDHQTITLQEMPEKAPMGQLPRSIELILDHDWVDKIKPGDRVQIVGVYRALATGATQGQHTSSGTFRTVVLVNHVQILGRDVAQVSFEQTDIRNIRQLATRRDILNILGRSISPSIHGHDMIKKAMALQLLSGVEKNLENGTHLRGDINILMVGDPSTAKSQLLRSAMTIAPLAVSTTGKGSSGVGLTAAVTSDPDTRERRLEAGAMVLADRGLVCVDEFDKMGENDRVAIHEAMEQQTVTIAKAGIHASLNARCSVLAAANPVYGQYDKSRRIQENIGLPDSLLSRFDLLFVVLDQMEPELDRRIATHVIRGHRTPHAGGAYGGSGHHFEMEEDPDDSEEEDDVPTTARSIWQRGTHHIDDEEEEEEDHDNEDDPHARDALHLDFLRKYLHYAKTRIQPVLTESARDWIAARYAELRARQDDRTIPVTARSLETVIRLATAHAKARLSPLVECADGEAALEILTFALYHERRQDAATVSVPALRTVSPDVDDDAEGRGAKRALDDDASLPDEAEMAKRARVPVAAASALTQQIWDLLDAAGDALALTDLSASLSGADGDIPQALADLEQQGRLMVSQGVIYKTT